MIQKVIAGVYAIKNTRSRRVYIGSSKNVAKRWREHKTSLNSGKHTNKQLQIDWVSDGEGCFEFCIIEFVDEKENDLKLAEQRWIDLFYDNQISCYNTKLNPTSKSLSRFYDKKTGELCLSSKEAYKLVQYARKKYGKHVPVHCGDSVSFVTKLMNNRRMEETLEEVVGVIGRISQYVRKED